jgi:hypothetical protein
MQMRCSPVLTVGAHGVVLGPQDGPIHHSIMGGHTWGENRSTAARLRLQWERGRWGVWCTLLYYVRR